MTIKLTTTPAANINNRVGLEPTNQGSAKPLLEITNRSKGLQASSILGKVCSTTARFIKVMRRSSGRLRIISTYADASVLTMKFFESLAGFEEVSWSGRLSFPAGGMFWVRTDAIKPLLVHEWTYNDFPEEADQGDGEIQHAIERMIGELPLSLGFEQAIFSQRTNRFYLVQHTDN